MWKGRFGGAEEDRTPDLRIANATQVFLSYRTQPVSEEKPNASATIALVG